MGTIALLIWPLIGLILFRTRPFQSAVIWTVLAGWLLLPTTAAFQFPVLPTWDKNSAPAFTALILAIVMAQSARKSYQNTPDVFELKGWIPKSKIARLLLALMVVGIIGTTLTNRDVMAFGPRVLPRLKPYDGLSMIQQVLTGLVPLFVARKYLARPQDHALLLKILVIAGIGYSFLAIVELIMSPQLHRWVYGQHSHSWRQNFRGGGYRPTIFLNTGLVVAIFFCMTTVAATSLIKLEDTKNRGVAILIAVYMLMILVAVNSLGALIIGAMLLPFALFGGVRLQLMTAAVIAAVVLLYPMLRGADIIPTDQIYTFLSQFPNGRAESLKYRFDNEDILLAHANARPLFGWGIWARSRVFNDFGVDVSVTDGVWVIIMGVYGWIGYIAQFGLISIWIILLAVNRRKYEISRATAALCFVLTANLVDMIPNSSITPLTWLISGALLGRFEMGRITASDAPDPAQNDAQEPRIRYRRDHPPRVRGRDTKPVTEAMTATPQTVRAPHPRRRT